LEFESVDFYGREDARTKEILKNERVCSRHFVSESPAASWDKFNTDWVPALNLGKSSYREKYHEAATVSLHVLLHVYIT
jgi:hypothetical protein